MTRNVYDKTVSRSLVPLCCVLGALAPVISTACGGTAATANTPVMSTAPPGPPEQLPRTFAYIPGELMTFEFKFRDVVVGRAGLGVGDPGVINNVTILIVRSQLETVGLGRLVKVVKDDIITRLNMTHGRTISQRAEMLFGEKHFEFSTTFIGTDARIEWVRNKPSQKSGPNKSSEPPKSQADNKRAKRIAKVRAQLQEKEKAKRRARALARAKAAEKPRAKAAEKPRAKAAGKPRAKATGKPRAKATGKPRAKATGKPRAKATGKPRTTPKKPKSRKPVTKRHPRYMTRYRLPNGDIPHDAHAALGAIRAFTGQPGTRLYFYAVSGRRIWMNKLEYKGIETVTTAMGYRAALRFEGSAQRLTHKLEPDKRQKMRTYTIWLSDDVKRMPLLISGKTEYGGVAIELVDYYRPPPP